jgi:hypothetical protein
MLGNLAKEFAETSSKSTLLKEAADAIATAMKGLVTVGVVVATTFNVAGKAIGTVAAALVFAAQGEFKKAWAAIQEGGTDISASIQAAMDRISGVWDKEGAKAEAEAPKKAKKIAAPIWKVPAEVEAAKKKLEEVLSGLRTEALKLGTEKETKVDLFSFRMDKGDLRDEMQKIGPAAKQYRASILDAAGAVDSLNRRNADAKAYMERFNATVEASVEVYNATRTPAEKYALEAERIGKLAEATAIDHETAARAMAQAWITAHPAVSQTVDIGVNAMSQLVQAAVRGGASIRDVWTGMLNSFISMVEQMVARWVEAQIAMAMVSIATGGATEGVGPIPGSAVPQLIGMRAGGGDVQAGGAYIVGERGPELFVPNTSGAIVPNNQVAGGSRTLVIAPNLIDGHGFGEWWDRNESMIVGKWEALQYRGRVGG